MVGEMKNWKKMKKNIFIILHPISCMDGTKGNNKIMLNKKVKNGL